MKKQLLFILLALLVPVAGLADVWQDPDTKVNYEYEPGSGVASVKSGNGSFSGSPATTGDIVIRERICIDGMDYIVTAIGSRAFFNCWKIESVIIPNSVTSIGEEAFRGCIGLTKIVMSNSVTSIDYCTFYDCSGLTSIDIPNSVTNIGLLAFSSCSGLRCLDIPNSVTKIAHLAFSGCTGLTNITIPNSVTSIEPGAFRECTSLSSVTLNCSEVGDWFLGNNHIKEVIFGDEVTSISNCAFQGCDSLSSVTIGEKVSCIGHSAFLGTLWHDSLSMNDGLIYVGKVAYMYSGIMPANTSIIIKDGTLGIAGGAFSDYCDMVSISIPNSVTNIGEGAFRSCI